MSKPKRIAIVIPHSYLNFNKNFVLSLLGVISSFYIWNGKTGFKYELNIFVQNFGWIDTMREALVLSAKKWQADYLLWLDTDMSFSPDIIARMLSRFEEEPELEAVTGLYTWKKPPFMPHVYNRLNKDTGKFVMAGGFPLNEPFVVEATGYGCLMIKTSKYPDNMRPWFVMEKNDKEILYGEDLYFFKKMHPVNMICDPNISCLHFTENAVDITSYLMYNKINKDEKGEMILTDELLKSISDEHISHIKRLQ